MNLLPRYELPKELQEILYKAKKLEWITLAYLLSVVVVMYLVLGSSQAMKTAWLEDALGMLPAISFLIASKFFDRPPTQKFPYGYHRVFSIAFLTGSVALFGMGSFLLIDSSMALIKQEHPTIGAITLFGQSFWLGWAMLVALLYSALPAMFLGYKKLPLAKKLHNKILFTDADTQKADYMTAFAAMLGILGVGAGLWWADAVAAIFISVSVIRDGFKNLKNAITDLMDEYPKKVGSNEVDELIAQIEKEVVSWAWVEKAEVRFRESGQVYFGEVFVQTKNAQNLVTHIQEGASKLQDFHWKIYSVAIMPVEEL